jgi:retinol dehydrogenase-12
VRGRRFNLKRASWLNIFVSEIRQETKIGEEIIAWDLDLGSFASVVAFVNKFEAEGGGRLDLLVENAAIATREFQKTQDGWERR